MKDNHSPFGALVNAAAACASLPVSDPIESDLSLKRPAEQISRDKPPAVKSPPSNPLLQTPEQKRPRCAAPPAVCAAVSPSSQSQQRGWPPHGAGGPPPPINTRRVPCKARNVSDDHTVATAYLEIPSDVKHGTQLMCSHPTCAGSGRRFRYCIVCELPVAKRNFVKRHSHGLILGGDSVQVARRRMAQNTTSPRQAAPLAESAETDWRGSETSNESEPSSHDTFKSIPSLNQDTDADGSDSSSNTASPIDPQHRKFMTVTLSQQDFQWLALLHSRPNIHDTTGMQKWMVRVIDTSEPDKIRGSIAPTLPFGSGSRSAASVDGGGGGGGETAASITEQFPRNIGSSFLRGHERAAEARPRRSNDGSSEARPSGVLPTSKTAEQPKKKKHNQQSRNG